MKKKISLQEEAALILQDPEYLASVAKNNVFFNGVVEAEMEKKGKGMKTELLLLTPVFLFMVIGICFGGL